jgi:DNA-binding NarL/FixJ family response regulator
MNIKVTIFEDNAILRRGLSTLINCSDGFECAGAFSNCDNLETNIKLTMPDPSLQIFVLIRNPGGQSVKV